jgi:hypothetical protein
MAKKITSTMGEIQRISLETCIIGPHRCQLIRWKRRSPMPSVTPVRIPNQTAIATKDIANILGGAADWVEECKED